MSQAAARTRRERRALHVVSILRSFYIWRTFTPEWIQPLVRWWAARQRVSERWSEVALDIEPLGMRPS